MELTRCFFFSRPFSRILALFSALLISQANLAANVPQTRLQKLEQQYIELSSAYYTGKIRQDANQLKRYTRPEVLLADVQNLISNKQQISAVVLIKYNLKALAPKIDHPAIIDLLAFLLEQNEWITANRLYRNIQNNADRTTISGASYLFARYFYKRNNYSKTLELLNGITDDLPGEKSNHAILLRGICLQKLKKHRQAMKVYTGINAKSSHYPAAILNTAIANIRQGWWTDGHLLLEKILEDPKYRDNEAVLDRLYLVLGYSLLYKEFYRDARDSFRNVGLDSPHTNRALLGIALAATNQEDYVGALNALTILKNKNSSELTVDEAYLLLPYIYEKLGQGITASSSYTDALNHYSKRIKKLDKLEESIRKNSTGYSSANNKNYFLIEQERLDYASHYPVYFINNLELISQLQSKANNSAKKKQIGKLYSAYQSTMKDIILTLIDEKKSDINSYMNQSRYGLARLYDSSAEEQ